MAGGMFDNFGSSVKGMFTDGAGEKAIIYIYLKDLSKKTTDEDFNQETKEINKLQTQLMKNAKNKISLSSMKDDIKSAFTPGSGSSEKVGEVDSEHDNFFKFKVQYNPATISLSSLNGKIPTRSTEGGMSKLYDYTFSGKSKLSFDLVFDACDNMNAFMLNDVVNTNFTGLANKGLDMFKNGGNNFSVRKRMDAMMSLMSSSETQQVIFFWSSMSFRGTLTDIDNKFTMFNPQGHPIRGEMHIELTQDKGIKDLNYEETYWQNAFKQVFKEKDGIGVGGGLGFSNKYLNNNFINLGL